MSRSPLAQLPGSGLPNLQVKIADEHPGWSSDIAAQRSTQPWELARRADDLMAIRSDHDGLRQQARAPAPPQKSWLQERAEAMDPTTWDGGTALMGGATGAALADRFLSNRYIGQAAAEAQKQRKDPRLYWNPMDPKSRGNAASGAYQRMDKILDKLEKKKEVHRKGVDLAFVNPKELQHQKRVIERASKSVDNLTGRALISLERSAPSNGPKDAPKIKATGLLSGTAHELGHSTGSQALRAPGTFLGETAMFGGGDKYRAARAMVGAGLAYAGMKTLRDDTRTEADKAKHLGGLAGVSAVANVPGLLELAEEHRAHNRGRMFLKGKKELAAYEALSGAAHKSYRAKHLAPLITTAGLAGLAARSAYRAWNE